MQEHKTKTKCMISLDYSSVVTVHLQVIDVDVIPENYPITNYKKDGVEGLLLVAEQYYTCARAVRL